MCARYTLRLASETVKAFFDLEELEELAPRYNIAPTQDVPAVTESREGDRRLRNLRWGLIPTWAKSPAAGATMINARAESLKDRPAFRVAFEKRRCLIPADGFFEWQSIKDETEQGSLFDAPPTKTVNKVRKQPYHFTLREGGAFAFAGVWDRWSDQSGNIVDSCCIITTVPNSLLSRVHDRMPVILDPADYGLWLDRHVKDPRELLHLLLPYPAEKMKATAVNSIVGNSRIDTPECIEPVAALGTLS